MFRDTEEQGNDSFPEPSKPRVQCEGSHLSTLECYSKSNLIIPYCVEDFQREKNVIL